MVIGCWFFDDQPASSLSLMSISQSLQASVRSAYRYALRAASTTFAGDSIMYDGTLSWCCERHGINTSLAFRSKIRYDILTKEPLSEPSIVSERVTLVRKIADILRKNVVQARKVEEQKKSDGTEIWSMFYHFIFPRTYSKSTRRSEVHGAY